MINPTHKITNRKSQITNNMTNPNVPTKKSEKSCRAVSRFEFVISGCDLEL